MSVELEQVFEGTVARWDMGHVMFIGHGLRRCLPVEFFDGIASNEVVAVKIIIQAGDSAVRTLLENLVSK